MPPDFVKATMRVSQSTSDHGHLGDAGPICSSRCYVNAASSGCRPTRSRSKNKTEESDVVLHYRFARSPLTQAGRGWLAMLMLIVTFCNAVHVLKQVDAQG